MADDMGEGGSNTDYLESAFQGLYRRGVWHSSSWVSTCDAQPHVVLTGGMEEQALCLIMEALGLHSVRTLVLLQRGNQAACTPIQSIRAN